MKKVFLFGLLISLSFTSYATHLMGGQLSTTYISSDTSGSHYYLELDLYRDTLGIDVSVSPDIEIWSLGVMGNYNLISTSTLTLGASGSVSTMSSVYGVEIYHFTDSITFPANGNYIVRWKMCCRNQAIINMSQPDFEYMSLLAYINVNDLDPNSSPTFLAPPVIYLPANNVWQYNPLPFDLDGDSLVWNLTVPLSSSTNAPIPDSVSGYQFLSDTNLYSNSVAPFSVNSVTGEITWSPSMQGNFVASLTIQEYRNGMLIGAMNRDMQFVVVADTSNFSPQILNMQNLPTNNSGTPYISINPAQNYQLSLLASDPDINDIVSISAFGESFGLNAAASTFSYASTGNGNEIEGNFSWTPDVSQVRVAPYTVVFRVSDNFFYYDETVQFEVSMSSTSLDEFTVFNSEEIYPNPAANSFALPLYLDDSQDLVLAIYNVLGIQKSSQKIRLTKGNHILVKNFNLENGQYFVHISDRNGLSIATKKLLVVK